MLLSIVAMYHTRSCAGRSFLSVSVSPRHFKSFGCFNAAGQTFKLSSDAIIFGYADDKCNLTMGGTIGLNDWILGTSFVELASVIFNFDLRRMGFAMVRRPPHGVSSNSACSSCTYPSPFHTPPFSLGFV